MIEQYTNHPAADLFPMMQGIQWKNFKEDIRQNGFQESVTLYKGQILDGRNRYKAAVELNMLDDLPMCEIDDDFDIDPYQWVISRNLHRRHLNESQRAKIAAKLAKLKHGDNQHTRKEDSSIGGCSIAEAANLMQVSPKSVERAKAVEEHGSPELNEMVERGEVAVSKAAKIAKEVPKEKQAGEAKKKPTKKKKQADKDSKEKQAKESKGQSTDRDTDQEAVEDFLRCRSPLNRLKKLVAELTDHQKMMLREFLK